MAPISQCAHPKAMQERLGHSSTIVTLERYGHLFPSLVEFVAAPTISSNAEVVHRLTDCYALVAHPYIDGKTVGIDGEFTSRDDELAVL